MNQAGLIERDRRHLWHPYASVTHPPALFAVASAEGNRLRLTDGTELIDGMASWWCAIHGYNHPRLNEAARQQLDRMSHVMFGGLTHEPAVALAERLVALTPDDLQRVFFADSGSVSVEVSLKMALQYWAALARPEKQRLMTVRGGYHGDTLGAMSVCDPVTGMHTLFRDALARHVFAPRPQTRFGQPLIDGDIEAFETQIANHAHELAAVILEPIVQGAGGMWFYSAEYLARVRDLCDRHEVLLIADEIATGFGRSGRLMACDHAAICPDILCLGKALTGGYMTLAATLTTERVAETICSADPGVFMHGPTFMANPLACAVALASVDLLLEQDWQARISHLQEGLSGGLAGCRDIDGVKDVRALGAIGVVELDSPIDMQWAPQAFVDRGVWVRPFGSLVYLMPPYTTNDSELAQLTTAVTEVVTEHAAKA